MSVTRAAVGAKRTVMVQVAAEARVVQVVVEAKLDVVLVGVPICRVAAPVLVRVMVCWVELGPGTLAKMRAAGLRARPGSGLPKPVGVEETVAEEVAMVRVPARGPVVAGAKTTLTKQDAFEARGPLQGRPPVALMVESARVKLPVVTGAERETGAEVRLVRVKRAGTLVLWMGTGP